MSVAIGGRCSLIATATTAAEVGTAAGFVVAIEPTDRRNDCGLAPDLLAQIDRRCGVPPRRLLADGTAVTRITLWISPSDVLD